MFSEGYKEKIEVGLIKRCLQSKFVLVVREKHSTRYFDAVDLYCLYAGCLKLVKERRDQGYYDVEGPTIQEPALSEEVVAGLDDGAIKLAGMKQWAQYKSEWADYEQDREVLVEANKAIQNDDGLLAYCVLRNRTDHEYEEVVMEALE